MLGIPRSKVINLFSLVWFPLLIPLPRSCPVFSSMFLFLVHLSYSFLLIIYFPLFTNVPCSLPALLPCPFHV